MSLRSAKNAMKRKVEREATKGWSKFEVVEPSRVAEVLSSLNSNPFFRKNPKVFKNNIYIVQVFEVDLGAWGKGQKALIRRNDSAPIHKWHDFQRIKNEIFGEESTALEVYPKQSRLIDEANLYWLWVLPEGFSCPIEV